MSQLPIVRCKDREDVEKNSPVSHFFTKVETLSVLSGEDKGANSTHGLQKLRDYGVSHSNDTCYNQKVLLGFVPW